MGLFENTCRPGKNDPVGRVLSFSLPLPRPPFQSMNQLRDNHRGFIPGTNTRPFVSVIKNMNLEPSYHRVETTTVVCPRILMSPRSTSNNVLHSDSTVTLRMFQRCVSLTLYGWNWSWDCGTIPWEHVDEHNRLSHIFSSRTSPLIWDDKRNIVLTVFHSLTRFLWNICVCQV